jgi:hypothetical protein
MAKAGGRKEVPRIVKVFLPFIISASGGILGFVV